MAAGGFVWCDLSALDLDGATTFYTHVLGWTADRKDREYRTAWCGDAPVAALFDMPPFFRKIAMPSFWMSYIEVGSVGEIVERAEAQGGRVELDESTGEGRYALIRDPLGAGFTVYEGPGLFPSPAGLDRHGRRAGHALHVSDQAAVAPFYEALFGWTMRPDGRDRWAILNAAGHPVAELHQSGDSDRGGYEYWGVAFAVDGLEGARLRIEAQGGSILGETRLAQGPALCAADGDGAAFFVVQRPG